MREGHVGGKRVVHLPDRVGDGVAIHSIELETAGMRQRGRKMNSSERIHMENSNA